MLTDRINHDHLDAVFNSIQEALIEFDTDNKIVRMNETAERLFGVAFETVVGKTVFALSDKLVAEADGTSHSVSNAIRKSDESVSGTCIISKAEGQTHLAWMLSPLEFKEKHLGTLLALIDYTDKQKLASALAQQREDFLAVLNHRLQTPVLAAQRIIGLILEGQFGEVSGGQKEVISMLGANMDEINRLMNMIMDIYRYRTSSKHLRMGEVNMKELLAKLHVPQYSRLEGGVEISCSSVSVHGDARELLRMIQHLLDNAVKYAKTKVSIFVSATQDSLLQIRVEDDGKGIADQDIRGLFEKFYLVSASGKYAPVTGAGLCLCSEIVKAHHGKISCSSSEDKGTCFEVLLPINSHGAGSPGN